MSISGTLHVVGVGPGDPELITLKAARIISSVPVVAYFAKKGRAGHARTIAAAHLRPQSEALRLEYPYTTEIALADPAYAAGIGDFYDEAAATLASRLRAGLDVALLCEGDPFFYGSAMYLFDRLAPDFATHTVPGISGMSGCWSQAGLAMAHGDDVLSVLPGTLPEDELAARLAGCEAAVIMKVGRNFPKIRAALARAGCLDRAVYVERGTMVGARVLKVAEVSAADTPYFSLVLVPGRQRAR
jgi:precorrin-2/cobalt-factor-2 C20-methyltransferase